MRILIKPIHFSAHLWLAFLLTALCWPAHLRAEESTHVEDWDMLVENLDRFFQKRGEHLYWLELDLDGKLLDSDYIWNGTSDLFFRIETVSSPKPIFSPTYRKNFNSGIIRVPFVLDKENRAERITITVLDDDSGGKVLDLILSNSSMSKETHSDTVSASLTVGTPLGAADVTRRQGKSHELINVIDYPQWLIQLEDCEVVAKPIWLDLPLPGESSASVFVLNNDGEQAGTARVHSTTVYPDLRKYIFAAAIGVVTVLVLIWSFLRVLKSRRTLSLV